MNPSLPSPAGCIEPLPLRPFAIAHARDLGVRRPLSVVRFGRRWVLFRDRRGTAAAAPAACPHRGADLGLGRVVDGQLECGYHGFRFSSDGACTLAPCEAPGAPLPKRLRLDTTPVLERGGFVWMRPDAGPLTVGELPVPETFVDDAWHHVTAEMTWNARLSRVVEAMLDFHHTPYAHRKVIGGFDRFVSQSVRVEQERIQLDATLAHRRFGWLFSGRVRLTFPATIELRIAEGYLGAVTLCPIDDERTWVGIRFFATKPLFRPLSKLLAWLALQMEMRLVQPDDARMAESAVPRSSDHATGTLVSADRAITEWYRLRRRIAASHDEAESTEAHARPLRHLPIHDEAPPRTASY